MANLITKGLASVGKISTRNGLTFGDGTSLDTRGIYGQTSFAGSQSTTITVADTYYVVPVAGTLDTGVNLNMTNGAASTFSLKNTSGQTRVVDVTAQVSATTTTTNVIGLKVAKAGTVIDASLVKRTFVTANGAVDLCTRVLVSLAADEEIQIYVTNVTATNAVVVTSARLTVRPV